MPATASSPAGDADFGDLPTDMVLQMAAMFDPVGTGEVQAPKAETSETLQRRPAPPAAPPSRHGPTHTDPPPQTYLGRSIRRFVIKDFVGEGATSYVFLAEHSVLRSRVALKLLRPALHFYPDIVQRFVGEGRALNLVQHPNVLQVMDVDRLDDGQYYMVMEYLEGETVEQMLSGGAVPCKTAAPLVLQACDALHAAHQSGVIHRDLKPANIYVVDRAGKPWVKIVDFGLARRNQLLEDEDRTLAGAFLGTALYMAPEQARGDVADARTDVYSMGACMYHMATGRPPFAEPSIPQLLLSIARREPVPPRAIHPDVPERYQAVILKALAKQPAARFQTMAEMARAVAEAMPAARPESARVSTLPSLLAPEPAASPDSRLRLPAALPVEVEIPGAPGKIAATTTDLSPRGAFIATGQAMPELFTRVRVAMTLQPPEGTLLVEAAVVRLEASTDARARGATPGFAVQFVDLTLLKMLSLEAVLHSLRSRSAGEDDADGDPEADRVIARLAERPRDDPYVLLGLEPDAGIPHVRAAGQRLGLEVDPKRFRPLRASQREALNAARIDLAAAEDALLDLKRRAADDARRGNVAGVARCIEAGLTRAELGPIREQYLGHRPGAAAAAAAAQAEADRCERARDVDGAAAALWQGLAQDPLNGVLHQRLWPLLARAAFEPWPGAREVAPRLAVLAAARSPGALPRRDEVRGRSARPREAGPETGPPVVRNAARRRFRRLALVGAAAALAAVVGVHAARARWHGPLALAIPASAGQHGAQAHAEILGRHLSARLARPCQVRVGANYQALADWLVSGEVDLAWLPPLVYAQVAERGVRALVVVQRGGRSTYQSALVVHRDSRYRSIGELRGARAGWVDPHSAAGYVFPRARLAEGGQDPEALLGKQEFLGSHRAVVEAVADRKVDVGGTYASYDEAGALVSAGFTQYLGERSGEVRILALSEAIPGDNIAARPGLADAEREAVIAAFLAMTAEPDGREAAQRVFDGATAFVRAEAAMYSPVKRALQSTARAR